MVEELGRPTRAENVRVEPKGFAVGVGGIHSVRLAVYESGGCKSHSFRGPGMISKRGGNASLACEV